MGSVIMRKLNEEFLQDYILSDKFAYSVLVDGIFSLYKMFTTLEVKSVEDLKNSPHEFKKFLMRNIHLLQDASKRSRETILSNIEFAADAINTKIRRATTEYVEDFANIIKEIFISEKDMHLLDVGAGAVPYSAFLEGETFGHVSTMDYEFYLPQETMQNLNVNGVQSFFKDQTPIASYDAIVGKQPCSAIEHIVRKCSKDNKPYFIELCNCNLPNKSKYIDEWYGWQDVLPDIDPNVKFYEDYALNVDASEEQVKKIIQKHLPKEEYEDVISPKVFADQMKKAPIKRYSISSNLWLQPDEIYLPSSSEYKDSDWKKEDDTDFLQMEMFERS